MFILSYTYSVLKIINNFRLYGFFLLNIAAYSEGDYFRCNSVVNLLATFDVVDCSSKPWYFPQKVLHMLDHKFHQV